LDLDGGLQTSAGSDLEMSYSEWVLCNASTRCSRIACKFVWTVCACL